MAVPPPPPPPPAPRLGHERDCPECQNGKHPNCTGWAIDPETDDIVECDCATGGHA